MHVLSHRQAGLRSQQCHVSGRPVLRKVADPCRHQHFVEERIEGDIGIRVGKAQEFDTFISKKLPDDRRLPGQQHERCIELSGQKFFMGNLRRIPEQFCITAVDAPPFEQFQRDRPRTAALRPDRNFSTAQIIQSQSSQFAASECP